MRTHDLLIHTTVGAAIVVALVMPCSLSAQSPTSASKTKLATAKWQVPRTPWGDPDLQGDFTNVYEVRGPSPG